MSRSRFQIHTAPANGTPHPVVATVTGEVDAANAAEFSCAVRELAGSRPVIVDLSQAYYIDSAGFAALDRLLADKMIVLVMAPDSVLSKAAELMCMPTHASAAVARHSLDYLDD